MSLSCVSFLDQQLKLDSADDAESICKIIENASAMHELVLRGNTIGVGAGERIGKALLRHPELKRCLWSDMFTGRLKTEIPPILKSMCSAMMQANCNIVELDLSDNAFGPIGAEGISDFLVSESAFSLEVLKLNNNGLGAGGKIVASCLEACYDNALRRGRKFQLKTFVAGRNRLEDPGARALSKAFKKIGTLEEIIINQNGIRSAGIVAMAEALNYNPNLRVINFNDNTCTDIGAKAVAAALCNLNELEVLDLGDCLCRKGAVDVIQRITEGDHPNIKYVDLSGSELGSSDAELIISKWRSAFSRECTLSLSNNCFGSAFIDLYQEVLGTGINLGSESDDEGTCDESDTSDHDYDDSEELISDEDSLSEEERDHTDNRDVDSLLAKVNSMSVNQKQSVSFLDKQLKLNTAEEAESICSVIEKAPAMHELVLRGNTIGVEAGERIGKALLKHPELERCLWSDMFTGRLKTEIPPILKSMCSAMMQANCNIVELDLSDNAFGPIGAEGISDFLVSESAFTLEVLKLNNNGLGAGGKIVASCLEACYDNALRRGRKFQLKTFVAGRNRLEDPGARALSKAFKKIGTLEEIIINQNGIRSDGIVALADALKYNPKLRVINFNDNTCTDVGSRAVAEVLGNLTKLEVLDLGDCLCRKGAVSVLQKISGGNHVNIKAVDLSGSELGPSEAELIIAMWRKAFKADCTLSLSNNCFGSAFIDLYQEVLGTGITLGSESDDEGTCDESDTSDHDYDDSEELISDEDSLSEEERDHTDNRDVDSLLAKVNSMSVNQKQSVSFLDKQLKLNTAEEAESICSVIEKAPAMHELVLRGNTIGVEAGERIGKALLKHPELERCLWSDMFTGRLKTEIPPILKSMCSAMMQANCNIVELDLSDNAFGPIGAEGISDFLVSESAFTLEVLKLNNNGLGAGGKIVASCLEACYDNALRRGRKFQLKTFVAGRNRLEDPGACALSKAFKKIGTLEEIVINQNGIRSDGIVAMADALRDNPNLRVINFNDNTCTEVGAKAVAAAIVNLTKLEVLNLGDCLCRKGAVNVVEKISEGNHVNIKNVDLSGSELGREEAEVIIPMWRNAFGRDCTLSITNNCFGSAFIDLYQEVLGSGIDMGAESDDEGSSCD